MTWWHQVSLICLPIYVCLAIWKVPFLVRGVRCVLHPKQSKPLLFVAGHLSSILYIRFHYLWHYRGDLPVEVSLWLTVYWEDHPSSQSKNRRTSLMYMWEFIGHGVSLHFRQHHNRDPSVLEVIGIEKYTPHWRGNDLTHHISRRETWWIFDMQCHSPLGLKIEWDINCYINS